MNTLPHPPKEKIPISSYFLTFLALARSYMLADLCKNIVALINEKFRDEYTNDPDPITKWTKNCGRVIPIDYIVQYRLQQQPKRIVESISYSTRQSSIR